MQSRLRSPIRCALGGLIALTSINLPVKAEIGIRFTGCSPDFDCPITAVNFERGQPPSPIYDDHGYYYIMRPGAARPEDIPRWKDGRAMTNYEFDSAIRFFRHPNGSQSYLCGTLKKSRTDKSGHRLVFRASGRNFLQSLSRKVPFEGKEMMRCRDTKT